MILIALALFLAFLFFRRLARRRQAEAMSARPYRYQLDTRRSPWSGRSRF